jgi:DNA-3-methyladenine glycosylase II
VSDIEIRPRGPFSLAAARDFAGGFPAGIGGGGVGEGSITLAFPVEGTDESAAIELWQDADGLVRGRSDAAGSLRDRAAIELWQDADRLVRGRSDAAGSLRDRAVIQAQRSLSLDHDGSGWPAVGERDEVVGRLQREHDFLRPVCFYSAYEAVTSFVIGQRISRRQSAVIKKDLAERFGDRPTIAGVEVPAFPRPSRLLEVRDARGLSDGKVRRLHGLAQAALDGRLDTEMLRALPRDEALARLRELPGVGPFTADGVLYRGCGVADGLPASDEMAQGVIRDLYGLAEASAADVERIAEQWRPYRMWAVVLLRMGWTRAQGPNVSYRRR